MPLALRAFLGLMLALVPATLVQIQLEGDARRERSAQEGELARRFVRLVANQAGMIVEGARQTLMAMSAHAAVRAATPSDECNAFLARIVRANPRYVTANVFSLEGDTVCSALPMAPGVNIAGRGYFQRVLRERRFEVGEYAVGLGTGRASLHFAAPMFSDEGELRGVIVVALSIEALNESLSALPLPPNSAAAIADRAGVILARSRDAERFVGQRLPDWAMFMLNAPSEGVYDGLSLDGVRRIAAYLPVHNPPEGLFISVGLDPSLTIDTAIRADRRATIIIVGSLLLTLILGLLAFQAAVERPITRMLAAAERWRAQDWRARVGQPGGAREFRRLAEAFDSMAEAVESRELARRRALSRLQAVIEVAPQLVLTADAAGRVDWVNPNWTDFTGQAPGAATGEGWFAAFAEEDRPAVIEALRVAVASARFSGRSSFSLEARLCPAEGAARWFALRGAPQLDETGLPIAWLIVAVDVDKLRRAEEAATASAEDLEATYRAVPAGLGLLDREMRFVAVNPELARTNGAPPEAHIGRTLREMAPHIAPQVEEAIRSVIETGQPVLELEVQAVTDGAAHVWLCNYAPVRDRAGVVRGVSTAMIDITARKSIEESERMLSREVDHRAQNVLTVARSLVRLSAADAGGDLPTLVRTLEGRIGALSRANSILTREKWLAADMRSVLDHELGVHAPRITLEGPPVRLAATAAQPLTLVLHELATNASKYGALSAPEGGVHLSWTHDAEGVELRWTERGGPMLEGQPDRRGFGSVLIDANISSALAGAIERHWEPQGLVCVIRIGAPALLGGAASPAGRMAGRRILIVNEDGPAALALAESLQAEEATVIGPAVNASEAMAFIAAAGRVDAAIVAPGISGALTQLIEVLRTRAVVNVWLGSPDTLPATNTAADLLFIASGKTRDVLAALLSVWQR